ncbi:MAG: hypothetical protein RIT81_29950 [Deltaproteobacteria bacterium]
MDPTLLLLASFSILALVFAATLFNVLREKRALGRLVESAVDFDAVQDAITQLPAPHQEIAAQLVEAINVRSTLDEALTKAVVRATNESFEPPLARRLITNMLLALVFFAPISLALVQVADRVVKTFLAAESSPSAQVYLRGQSDLEAPFSLLHSVFFGAAWLVAGLALWWALRWWLLRPEVREARFIRALLECAARLRPGVGAPVSARLCELVAPDRGIQRPVVATVLWFLAITAGWSILYATGSMRTQNASQTVYDVWPKTTLIGTTEALELPAHAGGRPLPTAPQPSLFIDAESVRLGPQLLVQLDADGYLPERWMESAPDVSRTTKGYEVLEPLVIATNTTRVETLLDTLEAFGGRYRVGRYHLVARRSFVLRGGDKRVQSTLPSRVGTPSQAPGLVLRVTQRGVTIVEENTEILFADVAWRIRLREAVRVRPDLYGVEASAPVRVQADPALVYERLVDVLGAADSSCMGTVDCGLPGLGLEFVLQSL